MVVLFLDGCLLIGSNMKNHLIPIFEVVLQAMFICMLLHFYFSQEIILKCTNNIIYCFKSDIHFINLGCVVSTGPKMGGFIDT
jgi:hypothetical protein